MRHAGRYLAIRRAVLPDSARQTMRDAETLCDDRTADDATVSTVPMGKVWWSMRFLNVATLST